jgi:hypothetical protein
MTAEWLNADTGLTPKLNISVTAYLSSSLAYIPLIVNQWQHPPIRFRTHRHPGFVAAVIIVGCHTQAVHSFQVFKSKRRNANDSKHGSE